MTRKYESLLLWALIQGISSLGETRFKEYSKHVECNKVGLQNLYKSQPGSSCVDLPHIQVFILLNAHMDLVWLEALGCTQLQDISQFEWLHPSGWHHISDDLVDLVSRVQAPVLNKQQKQLHRNVTKPGYTVSWAVVAKIGGSHNLTRAFYGILQECFICFGCTV